jgi:ectoine hydroxylase-related dioxygenase (phytanoyl-CoA dioxygenase family)
MLLEEQTAAYEIDGYVSFEGVLSGTEVTDLGKVTDKFVEQSRYVKESDDVFDLEPDHTYERLKLRHLKSPIDVHDMYRSTLGHEKIIDIVSQLIGPSIWTNGNKLNMKAGGGSSPVEWHQDWALYPFNNDDLLAVGVCIRDMNEANRCLAATKRRMGRVCE